MRAAGRDRRRGRLPLGLLGMAGLLLAVEGFVARDDVHFATDWSADRRLALRMLRRGAAGCEILCFGDSQIKFGVVPGLIGPPLGKRACNLAVHGGQPAASYFLLRRALEAGASPRALLISTKPFVLSSRPQEHTRPWSELASLRDCLDLGRTTRDAGFFAAIALGRLLPSARARFEIRANVLAALRGEAASTLAISARLRNWEQNRGAQVVPEGEFHAVPVERLWFGQPWACDPTNARYLERFFALAASRGLPVFWVLAPIQPVAQAESERTGYEGRFLRFVRSWLARFPNVVVLDGRHCGYDESTLVDPFHLNRRGAVALSADVAAAVGRSLADAGAAPRWVQLPAFRGRRERSPVEDLSQSIIALERRGAGVIR
jgi:hypothetical protein